MLVTIADYRDYANDTASSDAEITAALARAQTSVEGYIDRYLELQEHIETHLYVGPEPILLGQWPVSAITSIDKDGTSIDPTDLVVDKKRGMINHKNLLIWGEDVEITYTAGYATCPNDLRLVICELAKARLSGDLEVTGPASARAVRKDTLYGVSAIEYEPMATTATPLEFYPELGPYVRILDKYRRAYEVVM